MHYIVQYICVSWIKQKILKLLQKTHTTQTTTTSKKNCRLSGVWRDSGVYDLIPMCTGHIKRSFSKGLQK